MFHKAIDLKFNEGTELELTFQDGKVIIFDMSCMFAKYPQLSALKERSLFLSGKLSGFYGIIWTDEIDIEVETIYEEGKLIRTVSVPPNSILGSEILSARARKAMSQTDLAKVTGIDQSDISKIERGVYNPSVNTLKRIADALDCELVISLKDK